VDIQEITLVGPLYFTWGNIVAVFVPEHDHEAFARDLEAVRADAENVPPLLDPRWGLERMIAALRGLRDADMGTLPP
jgi:hypothetical protein